MKIVFFGTPDFAVPSLQFLLDHHQVLAVVTQPDRQKGRGKKLQAPPVKETAEKNGVTVFQPNKVRDPAFVADISKIDADMFVVVAYGQILPVALLEQPRLGCINVHGSLLPAYRGAAPIQWAIINGEGTTGITIMYMEKGLDTGDMILKKELPITPKDDYGTLHDKMAHLGVTALDEAMRQLEQGTAQREKQDHSQSSYAPMLTRDTGHIDWHRDARDIHNLVRGLSPAPGAYTTYNGEMLRICRGQCLSGDMQGEPGEIINIGAEGLLIKAGQGGYLITELQAPGGKKMSTANYLRGHSMDQGIVLQ